MATEYLRPDAALTTNDYAAGDETDIDDTVFLPPGDETVDANWLTLSGNATSATAAGPVGSPSATPTGTVTLHAWLRKYPSADQTDGTADLWIVDNGTDRASSGATAISNATGERLTASVAASSITGGFANLSFRLDAVRSGGSPGNRRSVEIGAIAFEVDVPAAGSGSKGQIIGSMGGIIGG